MLKLFNTLTRKKEAFKPLCRNIDISKCRVGLYTCGPTVYNYAHIGNLRTYIFEDILRRTLESNGFKVKHVMNITDIDDKIIRDSAQSKKTIFEFTKPYEKAFFGDLAKLNIKKAWKYPKATAHIKEMIALIQKLVQKKFAYITEDGIYFKISKFKKYGKLSKTPPLNPPSLVRRGGNRISSDEYDKTSAVDFALWKFKKLDEPSWKAPFGDGRPGWHIECSAMSMKYLGSTFDIHTGGVDNIFPHHENEIAQSESATGKKFANYFIEGEHLLVDGEKMSKSLKNIFTLRDLEAKNINPLAYRYFVLGAHYRSKLNFTWEALGAAEKALERLHEFTRVLNSSPSPRSSFGVAGQPPSSYSKRGGALLPFQKKFNNTLSDDLNTPKALVAVWELIREYNKNIEIYKYQNADILRLLYEFDKVLGLGLKNIKHFPVPPAVLKLIQKREQFRKEKEWQKADEIRAKISKMGYVLLDTSEGPKLSPVSAPRK